MEKHTLYMKRALEMASLGKQDVSPNPMVGCVVVFDDKIIGEGYHQKFGGPHAEVNAINSVKNKDLLKEATVYVTLEPCSHYGKTPPCADLLIKSKVKKVVVCNTDPNPLVSGRGLNKLQENGIEVTTGVLSEEGEDLNKKFFWFMRKKSPYVILKWAETADGFIARENYSSKWISNWLSRKMVHKWRAENDGIMVGKNTAIYDNPSLNVRDWKGENPLRIVIDRDLKLDKKLNLFDEKQATICYNLLKNEQKSDYLIYKKVEGETMEEQILQDLYERKVQSVLIEGGSALFKSFINKNLWQEARVFKSANTFGKGIAAPDIRGKLLSLNHLLEDNLLIFTNY